jgi:excisionase family DNA binding protein
MTKITPKGPISSLLTIAEAADRLRVNPKTVRRWIGGGELAAYRVGRQWRITEDQLTQFLRA